jgi:dihydroflavonol-4-reductase
VGDVADPRIRAVTHPATTGERFLAVAGESMSMLDVASVLKSRLGAAADRVPTRQIPDWLVRLERFVRKAPTAPPLPDIVWINKPVSADSPGRNTH